MTNKRLFAILGTLGIAGASLVTLVNAQTVTGTVTGGTPNTGAGMRQELTSAQKAIMTQVKVLFDAGKKDEAKALLTANGINLPAKGAGHGRGMGNMRELDTAIASGDYAKFQTLASTSPFASITQATFNLLTPEFLAKQNAEKNIQTILTNAGIQMPQHQGPPTGTATSQ